MDKFEYKVKLDEIKSLISQGDFATACDVADTVDFTNVRNVRTLCMVSDLYKKNRKFDQSLEVLLLAYDKQKTRPIVKSLCELSIELGELIAALEYYKEFVQIAPKDPNRFILQYKLYKAQGVSLEEQIGVLEELKKHEYLEKWAYELAELYHRVGMGDKCVEECNELILWFVDGRYVIKAFELKAQHEPLTEQETYKYELLRQAGGELNIQLSLREEEKQVVNEKGELEVKKIDVSPYNTQSLQAVVAEGLQDIIDAKTTQINLERKPESYEEAVAMDNAALSGARTESASDDDKTENKEEENLLVTQVINPIIHEEPVGQELLEDEPLADEDTDNSTPLEATPIEKDESLADEYKDNLTPEENIANDNIENKRPVLPDTDSFTPLVKQVEEADADKVVSIESAKSGINSTGIIEKFHKGSNMDEILSQGYDGQISLVVPEEHKTEKQITGQISIDDVMEEWEKKKKESEERRVAEVKERVRKETNTLLADFDESTKSGLLEQIEGAMVSAALKEEHDRIAAGRPKEIKVADIDKDAKNEPSITEEILQKAIDEELGKINKMTAEDDGVEELAEIEENVDILEDEASENAEDTEIETESENADKADDEQDTEDKEEAAGDDENAESEDIEDNSETEDKDSEDKSDTESKEVKEASEENKEKVEDRKKNKQGRTKKINSDEVRSMAKAAEETKAKESKDNDEPSEHKTRELTDTEKEQFAAFIHHRSTRKQLAEALDNVSLAAYTGNIIVTGEEDTEVTAFSKLLIREIQMSDNNFTGKVAKVSGEKLNRKDIAETVKTVANGALIVSEAEGLKEKTLESLVSALQSNEMGIVVILQGRSDTADKLTKDIKGLAESFNLRVDLRAFDDKTLVEYAKTYAYDNEYTIDDLGVLALHTRIADMQTADHEVTLSEIEEIIDDAIYYADKKTPAHFFDVLFGKRYDEEDMIVLREKDFMHY